MACPSALCVQLGHEIAEMAVETLWAQYRDHCLLDLSNSALGVAEVIHTPSAGRMLKAVCVQASRAGLDTLQATSPNTHVVKVSTDAVSFALQTAAIDAKAELERQQEALRQAVANMTDKDVCK